MKKLFLICTALCVMLSGCVVHDHHRPRLPSAKVVVPVPVVVQDKAHCPPGQAKKGNC
ncbi:MAG TPA: hypothetical protein VGD45_21020 [Steroidobacter sp.]|uniref:hypothetical protein n=1 Tax=Steroidobacter sp. TaxID=1978227 RepID=UPI002EDB4553